MFAATTPPAIVKEREDLFKLVVRAKEAANDKRRAGLINTSATDSKLAICRDELDRRLRVFLDGEQSIEDSWRRICETHGTQHSDASDEELVQVRKMFQDHLAYLNALWEHTIFQSMAELGFAVPSYAKVPLAIEKTQEIQTQVLERWPLTQQEFAHGFPVDVDEVVYIGPGAFLRSMAAIIWNAFRHPFSTTYVDLSTGESVTIAD